MGISVFKLWPAVALVGILFPVQPARSSLIPVQASARVMSAADVWAQAATQMLLSTSPGVLLLTIPGSAGAAASSIELTAANTAGSGSFAFTGSGMDPQTIGQVMKLVEQGSTSLMVGSSLSTELASRGVLSGRGVQIALLKTAQGAAGGGALAVIVTFD